MKISARARPWMAVTTRASITLFLALRGLRESLLSTGLMIVAVAVGVGFEVPSTANIAGYRAELMSQSLDAGFGDVRLRAERGPVVRDADALAARLGRLPGVNASVGPPFRREVVDQTAEDREVQWLSQEGGARGDGRLDRALIAVRADHYGDHRRVFQAKTSHEVGSIHPGQPVVGDYDVWLPNQHSRQRFLGAPYDVGAPAIHLQDFGDVLREIRVVVDNENAP